MPSHQGYFPPILGASLNPLPSKPMASAHTLRHMAQLLAQLLLLLWLLPLLLMLLSLLFAPTPLLLHPYAHKRAYTASH